MTKTFDRKLFVFLATAFILATVIGTLSHECGHYIVAKSLGYKANLHYASAYWYDPGSFDSINALTTKYWKQIEEGSSFPGKEKYDQVIRKYSNDGLLITVGGPLQSLLTGTIGLMLLFVWKKSFKAEQNLTPRQWTLVFITLFWLRQAANLIVGLGSYLLTKELSYKGDEIKIALKLGLPFWSLIIITGSIGILVLLIVIFKFIPKRQRQTFLLSGVAGGVTGYILLLYLFHRRYLQPTPFFLQLTPFPLQRPSAGGSIVFQIILQLTKTSVMNSFKTLSVLILSIAFLQANAQSEIPKGFKKGTILLSDNSSLSGYIRDNIRSNASIAFISTVSEKKKNYSGVELISAEIEGIKFLCIKGDFFKVISQGELNFLQKASDASGKPSYNGNEAVFSNGTEGKPDDYFIYNSKSNELKLVSKKNLDEVVAKAFAGNTAAIDKAKAANGDVAQLKDAVEIYNNGNNK